MSPSFNFFPFHLNRKTSPMSTMKLLPFHLLAFLFAAIPTHAHVCYWSNGKAAPTELAPCPGKKFCCTTGDACLSNNVCLSGKYSIPYRGACSDQSWPAADCPHVCHDEVRGGGANIRACPGNPDGIFTCGTLDWITPFCAANLSTHKWEDSYVSTAQVVLTPESFASDHASPTPDPGAKSSNLTIQLGAGLGVGLGVPLLLLSAGMLMLWVRRRKKRKDKKEPGQGQGGDHRGENKGDGITGVDQSGGPSTHDNHVELPSADVIRRELP